MLNVTLQKKKHWRFYCRSLKQSYQETSNQLTVVTRVMVFRCPHVLGDSLQRINFPAATYRVSARTDPIVRPHAAAVMVTVVRRSALIPGATAADCVVAGRIWLHGRPVLDRFGVGAGHVGLPRGRLEVFL